MRTNQELFNNAYRYHVLEGNPLGINPSGSGCSYAQGCAIGCQLSQESLDLLRSNDDDDTGIHYVMENYDLPELEGADVEFCRHLQYSHDLAAAKWTTNEEFSIQDDQQRIEADPTVENYLLHNYHALAARYGLEVPSEN
jgi:hypothetical protein